MKKLAIIAVLALASFRAEADQKTGTELLRECSAAVRFMDGDRNQTPEEDAGLFSCFGYVLGFRDAMSMMNSLGAQSPVCFPGVGIDNEQAARIVVKELRENPQLLHRNASELLMGVFTKNFPCKDWKTKLKARPPTESF